MKKFHLNAHRSPTHANLVRVLTELGWQASDSPIGTVVNESWLQFSSIIADTLEYKHLLAAFLHATQLTHLMPETFFIDDQNWLSVLETIHASFAGDIPWILKPSMLNNGQHIHLFSNLDAIATHFHSSHRMGGPQVLQRYIDKPQLIKGPTAGHKFSIRQLVVLSTHVDSVLFPNGYLNIALKPYPYGNYEQLAAHLTNEHLDDKRINVVQRLSNDMAVYQPYKAEIIHICRLIVNALKKHYATLWHDSLPRIACFGFDFIVESLNQKIWLLEVNHGPCFPVDEAHPLFNTLYKPFWEHVIAHCVDKQASDFIILG